MGVWLYEQFHPAPYLLNMTILLSACWPSPLLNPVLRTVGSEPTTEDETTAAQFDRVEEGGGSV